MPKLDADDADCGGLKGIFSFFATIRSNLLHPRDPRPEVG
jgi:hypothetical protein